MKGAQPIRMVADQSPGSYSRSQSYRLAFEATQDGIVIVDADNGAIEDCNPRIEALFGYRPDDLRGRQIWEVPLFRNASLGPRIFDALRHSSSCRIEEWLITEYRHGMFCDLSCCRLEQGTARYMVVSIRDITERKRNETALRDSEERFRTVVEGTTDYAIFMMDTWGKVVSWNPGAERILQYEKGEILGRDAYVLFTPEDRARGEAAREMDTAKREGRAENERWHLRRDGTRFFASGVLTALRRPDGELRGFAKVMRDITERRANDEAMREAEKLESIGLLAGGVAHDFNNLLTGIIGGASLAAEDVPPGSSARKLMDDVVKTGMRAADLTSQLLAYAGKGRVTVSLVDISQATAEIPQLLHASIPHGVGLEMNLQRGLPYIEADLRQVQQIAMNLVINAAEAIEGEGLIRVSTTCVSLDSEAFIEEGLRHLSAGEYVVLEVRDTGTGMDDCTKGKVFDPFFTTKFTGRGLGLAAVWGIVRRHGGGIQLTTAPGQGSTFRVYLPAVPRPAKEDDGGVREREREADPGRGAILVVDDDAMVRRVSQQTLERRGFHVISAENGREAVDRVRRDDKRIALVVLDLSMPVMSGEEAYRAIKAIRPELPVLISSGYSEGIASDRFGGKDMGEFIQKPYTADGLADRVRQMLGEVHRPCR
ncbi:MAG: PAS domain S-box protein [Candidatus Solibacter sp.]